jgi:hypothetical protein
MLAFAFDDADVRLVVALDEVVARGAGVGDLQMRSDSTIGSSVNRVQDASPNRGGTTKTLTAPQKVPSLLS